MTVEGVLQVWFEAKYEEVMPQSSRVPGSLLSEGLCVLLVHTINCPMCECVCMCIIVCSNVTPSFLRMTMLLSTGHEGSLVVLGV